MDRPIRLLRLIRDYRKARGLTQVAIAQQIHVPPMTYYRLESGRRRLRESEFNALCGALGLDRIALLHEAGYTAFEKEQS